MFTQHDSRSQHGALCHGQVAHARRAAISRRRRRLLEGYLAAVSYNEHEAIAKDGINMIAFAGAALAFP